MRGIESELRAGDLVTGNAAGILLQCREQSRLDACGCDVDCFSSHRTIMEEMCCQSPGGEQVKPTMMMTPISRELLITVLCGVLLSPGLMLAQKDEGAEKTGPGSTGPNIHQLLEITFPHAYYQSGVVADYGMRPTLATLEVTGVEKPIFRSRIVDGAFKIYAGIRPSEDLDDTASDREEFPLTFLFQPTDPDFANVTILPEPTDPGGEQGFAMYANNLPEEPDPGTKLGDWLILPIKPGNWTYNLETALEAAGEEVESLKEALEDGEDITIKSWSLLRPDGKVVLRSEELISVEHIKLDFEELPEGCYRLRVAIDEKLSLPDYQFIYLNEFNRRAQFIMYQCFLDQRPVGRGAAEPAHQEQKVRFAVRKAYWRYHIVPAEGKKPLPVSWTLRCDGLNGTKPDFGSAEKTILPNGQSAVTFTSDCEIPFRQSATGKVTLTDGAGAALLEELPSPSPSTIIPTKDAKGEVRFYADIYVNL